MKPASIEAEFTYCLNILQFKIKSNILNHITTSFNQKDFFCPKLLCLS